MMEPETYVRTYDLPHCWIHEHTHMVHTVFKRDRSSSVFAPPKDQWGNLDADFLAAAREMGYSDPVRYAVEHELAHQIVADEQGREASTVVWYDAHWAELTRPAAADLDAEEHLANRLQQFMNFGKEDAEGCLRNAFGRRLPLVAQRLLRVARPWLAIGCPECIPADDSLCA